MSHPPCTPQSQLSFYCSRNGLQLGLGTVQRSPHKRDIRP